MTRVMRAELGSSDPEVALAVERWLAGGDCEVETLTASERRQLVKLRLEGQDVLLKRFLPRTGRRRWRTRLERPLGRQPADREWRSLVRLFEAGAPVPEPLAALRLGDGQTMLAARFIEGPALVAAGTLAPKARRRLLAELGAAVARVHAAGMVHGDLHVGNVVCAERGPVLVDLQHAKRRRSRRARLVDLGALDFSLAQSGFSLSDRLRVRLAGLGADSLRPEATRRAVREIARLGTRRGRRHFRSRTRRCLRPGRRFARVATAPYTGMRLIDFPEGAVVEALDAHTRALAGGDGDVLKRDHRARVTGVDAGGRRVVVKEVLKGGLARRLADGVRGSPARRAWVGGHGLLARGIRAAAPLAYVETRRLGIAVASAIVLEDLRPRAPVSEVSDPGVLEPLLRLVLALHRHGVVHGDLQGFHVLQETRSGQAEPELALIDLEGVTFPRRLSDDLRIRALAELNASLTNAHLSAETRRNAFRRYARALPFQRGDEAALEEIVARSLARGHLWRGEGCRANDLGAAHALRSSASSPEGGQEGRASATQR